MRQRRRHIHCSLFFCPCFFACKLPERVCVYFRDWLQPYDMNTSDLDGPVWNVNWSENQDPFIAQIRPTWCQIKFRSCRYQAIQNSLDEKDYNIKKTMPGTSIPNTRKGLGGSWATLGVDVGTDGQNPLTEPYEHACGCSGSDMSREGARTMPKSAKMISESMPELLYYVQTWCTRRFRGRPAVRTLKMAPSYKTFHVFRAT